MKEFNLNTVDVLQDLLPKYVRYFVNTLFLYITIDPMKTIKTLDEMNIVHNQIMYKWPLLWNTVSCSKSLEIINNILGCILRRPKETHWKFLYDSLTQMLYVKNENDQLCKAFAIKHISIEQKYLYRMIKEKKV